MQSPDGNDAGTDLHAGWDMMQRAEGTMPVEPDVDVAWGHAQEAFQTAGLNFSGLFGRQARRATGALLRQGDTPRTLQVDRVKLKGILDQIPASLDEPALDQKFTDTGTLNLPRSHIGNAPLKELSEATGGNPARMLDAVENAEDLGKVFNIIGREMNLTDAPRTHASIRARTKEQLLKDISPMLDGRQLGLADDKQLYALSSLHASVGDEMIATARAIKAGRATDEMRIKFLEQVETVSALESMLVNNTREVARALSARRIYANSQAYGDLSSLTKALQSGGQTQASVDLIAGNLLTDLLKEGQTSAVHNAAKRSTPLEAAIEFWKSNVLSAPATHVLNVGSNSAVALYERFAVDPVAAAISTARRGLGLGKDEGVYFSETAPGLHGAFAGLRDGLRSALEVMVDPTSSGNFGAASKADVGGSAMADITGRAAASMGLNEQIGQQVGGLAVLPLRLMKAEDEVFKATAYRSKLASLQMRAAMDQGLQGPALTQYLDNALDHPSYDMHKEAVKFADTVTFQDRNPGGLIAAVSEHVSNFMEALPIFKFVTPFIRTMSNLVSYAIDNSPLAPMGLDVSSGTPMAERLKFFNDIKSGGAKADVAMSRFALGSAIAGAAYTLYQKGVITGPGPDSPAQMEALKATGYKPNAIIIGDKSFTFDRLDPFASQIEMITGAFDKARFAKEEKDAAGHILDGIMSLSNHIMNSTFMESAQRFMQVFFGGDEVGPAAAKFLGSTLAGFIPYEAALAAAGRATDNAQRVPSYPKSLGLGGKDTIADMGQIVAQTGATKLPWNRDELRPARYWDGTIIVPEAHQLARLLLPVQVSTIKNDPASLALARNGVGAPIPIPQVTLKGVKFNLLDFDLGKGLVYDAYIKDIGEARKAAVDQVISMEQFDSTEKGVNSQQAVMLERAMIKGQHAGEALFFTKTLPGLVEAKNVDLNPLARALGLSLEETLGDIKKGEITSSRAGRFNARGTPGKQEVDLPMFDF